MPADPPTDLVVDRSPRRSLASEIAATLREQILSGKLPVGRQLGELEVADAFGTSQAPVREAFSALRSQGLLVTLPRRGTFVSGVSLADARAAYAVRRTLDPHVVRNALENLTEADLAHLHEAAGSMANAAAAGNSEEMTKHDMDLHGLLWRRCESELYARIWEMLETTIRKFINVAGRATFGTELDAVADMHRHLVDLVASGDADAVITELRHQLDLFWERIDEDE